MYDDITDPFKGQFLWQPNSGKKIYHGRRDRILVKRWNDVDEDKRLDIGEEVECC